LRREFIYRKGVEQRTKSIQDKKERLKRALDGKKKKKKVTLHIPSDL
jgi:hypothetical protein